VAEKVTQQPGLVGTIGRWKNGPAYVS